MRRTKEIDTEMASEAQQSADGTECGAFHLFGVAVGLAFMFRHWENKSLS